MVYFNVTIKISSFCSYVIDRLRTGVFNVLSSLTVPEEKLEPLVFRVRKDFRKERRVFKNIVWILTFT
jgi:hypothetical protein